jgi:1-acyl-sn-glycerol-3-phosphate acyltransferase
MRRFCYECWRLLFAFIFRVIFRTRIIGRERVPQTGGLLLVANHSSLADPPLLGVTTPRPVDFMAMVELFRHPIIKRLVQSAGAFAVDRSRVDHVAAREAIRRLRDGRCVGIFPEGGIRVGEQSVLGGQPVLKPGAETLALLGHAVILPVVIRGSRLPYDWHNWLRRETLSVTYGAPFCLWQPDHQRRDDFAVVIREQLLNTVELT